MILGLSGGTTMRHLLLISLAISLAGTAMAGDIFCNAQGRECGDRPTTTANVPRSIGNGGSRSVTSNSDSGVAGGDGVAARRAENAQFERARQEMRQDFTGKRAQQCKEATDYYQKLITASVINKTDKEGRKLALSDAEADQARLNAKIERDRLCSQAGG
jgi:hypothetical protein